MNTEVQTPDWVKHAVFYQIFPDRFAKSEKIKKPNNLEPWDSEPTIYGLKGGDLIGVVEHLDYLHELGITAIYFNPIFQSASNHRYHTHDYYQVDPILGGNPALHTLLEACHARGIRVVLDGVFNHASRGFFQFNSILELGEKSPYLDWFTVKDFPLNAYAGEPNYDCWVNLPALPKFNTANPQVVEYIYDIARYWLEQGIDGWRLDVPFEIKDEGFWQGFRRVVKNTNPEAYIVGEVAWEAQQWLQGDQFDAVMNYQFTAACLGFFGGMRINRQVENNMMGLPDTLVRDAASFSKRMHQLLEIYPYPIALVQLNLLSSHDMPRFVSLVDGDLNTLRLATLFQMTYPGAPCIYYGDEIGLQGGSGAAPEPSRETFPWQDQTRWNMDLLAEFKALIALRHNHEGLRTGEFITLHAEGNELVYLRRLPGDELVIVINNGETPLSRDLPMGEALPEGSQWRAEFGQGEARVFNGSLHGLNIPPRTGVVLIRRS